MSLKRTQSWVREVKGRITARFKYRDEKGKVHEVTRSADSERKAKRAVENAWDEISAKHALASKEVSSETPSNGNNSAETNSMTFNELAEYYDKRYFVQAEYNEVGTKIDGGLTESSIVRNRACVEAMKKVFGDQQLSSISYERLVFYKAERLKTVSITSVNKELIVLRQMLKQAKRNKFISHNPWDDDDPQHRLINHSGEVERTRRIDRDEEVRLLTSCLEIDRPLAINLHIYTFCIWALDTAMRRNEILKTIWADVDLEKGVIFVPWENTKKKRAKFVPISLRMKKSLLILKRYQTGGDNDHVFNLKYIYEIFGPVRKKAKLDDVKIHDMRRTCISRAIEGGVHAFIVAKVAGHSVQAFETLIATLNQTFEYFIPEDSSISQFRAAIDEYNAITEESSPELFKLVAQRFDEVNMAAGHEQR